MKKAFLFLITAIVLVGCSSNEPIAPVNEQNSDTLSPYTEIIERANWYYSQLNKETRSASPKVRNIELLSNHATRSDVNDSIVNPIYYIVNYEDEAGFVMLGGNESAEPLAAISDEGNLSFSDTTNNPGLAAFINEISNPTITVPSPVLPVDSVTGMTFPKVKVDPLLDPMVRKWGKSAPFNQGLPILDNNGTHAKVNDTQLSVLMVMTYYEWPNATLRADFNYDWKGIKSTPTHSEIGELLMRIGNDKSGLKVNYGITESTADQNNLIQGVYILGYGVERYGSARTLSNIKINDNDSVKNQLPMIMWGENNNKKSTWVIDGARSLISVYGHPIITKDYLHCVWGNYGRGNGYYLLTRLDKIGGNRSSKDQTDSTYEGYGDSDKVPEFINNSYLYQIYPVVPPYPYN